MSNNPWNKNTDNSSPLQEDNLKLEFEDNFNPSVTFAALPDSQQYLASLERRLQKIKKDSSVLGQLTERREICMENLLNNQINLRTESDIELEAAVNNERGVAHQEILRFIRPEQPLSVGEIVQIIQHDQLEIELEKQQEQEEEEVESDGAASR